MIRSDLYPIFGLAVLMAVTRFHHFAFLPDASLAVFFLAGLFWTSPWRLALFLAEAGLIDYLAVTYGGINSWCITPAYAFLIPTYGVLWLGGRLSRGCSLDEALGIASVFAVLLGSALIAFGLSNISFYVLSGYFAELDFKSYTIQVLPYLVPYLAAPLIYTASVLAARWAGKHWKFHLLKAS